MKTYSELKKETEDLKAQVEKDLELWDSFYQNNILKRIKDRIYNFFISN